MPFIGVHRETGQRLDITTVEQPRRVLRSGEWVCQLCGAPLIVKAGLVVRPHFAHHAAAECRTDYRYHPESPAHREAKATLAGLLRQYMAEYTDAQIEYEAPIPEVRREVIGDFKHRAFVRYAETWGESAALSLATMRRGLAGTERLGRALKGMVGMQHVHGVLARGGGGLWRVVDLRKLYPAVKRWPRAGVRRARQLAAELRRQRQSTI